MKQSGRSQYITELAKRDAIEHLEQILRSRGELKHLEVEERGKSLTLVSRIESERVPHAKFTLIEDRTWGLSLPRHTGRWERTPFIGRIEELTDTLLNELSFHLAPR